MKKSLNTFSYLCICMLCMNIQILFAQGLKGNTITFDETNCTQLRANNSSFFSFLRHNQAPIQILNGNPTANSTSGSEYYHTIAPLNEIDGNGIFATGGYTIANNMAFSQEGNNNGKLEFYNFKNNYNALCFAVMAPRGYRFTEYYMDIRSTQAEYPKATNVGAADAVITRYTYNEGSTWEYTLASDESMTLSGTDSEIYTHTLRNAGNILYFRVTFTDATQQWCVHMNELRLRYVIDDEFTETIPNSSNENQVRTGILNLGEFTQDGSSYVYTRTNVTDLEDINIVAEDGTSQMSISNGSIHVPAGTYWIESPAKFRILGATLNFAMDESSTTTTWESVGTDLASILGKKVKISDGNGNYLVVSGNGSGATNTTIDESATTWIITNVSGDSYYIQTETGNFLCRNGNGTLTTQEDPFEWTYYTSYNGDSQTSSYCFICNNGTRDYGIRCYNATWAASRTDRTDNQYTPTPLNYFVETITGDDYTATLYGTSATESIGTVDLDTNNPTVSISADGLNNDGVKFTVTGPATFTIDLTLLPLDPNLQNLEFDYLKDGAGAGNKVSASATNFKFNNGEPIMMPIEPGVSNPQVVFRNAFNENRLAWYDGTGSGEKVSNYYLIDSEYEMDNTVLSPAPDVKVNADRAGTTNLEFSNIKLLTPGTETVYREYEFKKDDAGYSVITLTTSPQSIDIYTADKPVYCIMTAAGKAVNNHIAYTFYDVILQGVELEEEPVITVTPLYTSSLKRSNVKVALYNNALDKNVSVADDSDADTNHTFYGIKVNSQVTTDHSLSYGYLTSADIREAIKTAMNSQNGIYSGDVMRTILYVDMSELKSISGDADTWVELMLGTADNCLFFMPSNFSISQSMPGGGIIAGGENGTAVTDITIHDQQPFFTPYSFRTSTYVAHYERSQTKAGTTGSSDKPTVTHSTLVLPFTMKLNANGNLKPTSDSENTNLTFYNLGSTHPTGGSAGNIDAYPVTTGEATANTPYHIKSTAKTETTSFVIDAQGVTFAVTPLNADYTHDLTSPNSDLTAHGSFYGVSVPVENNILYFSKDYFLNSANLTNGATTIKLLPYRAYYTTSTPSSISSISRFSVLFIENNNNVGETEYPIVSEDAGLVDAVKNVENENAKMVWFNMNGQKMNSQPTLPGVYVVNGKKVLIK
ncbi:MAG: hypothetical protein IJK42_10830 [Prevotella sp.]|nr:hypothetical protein [Prevotella sp.]